MGGTELRSGLRTAVVWPDTAAIASALGNIEARDRDVEQVPSVCERR